jgi:peptidyl-tRNA hydrolase, PTH1 family
MLKKKSCTQDFFFNQFFTVSGFRFLVSSYVRSMKFLIAGLGNIGPEYELTRHNIGFLVLDQLADEYKAEFTLDRHAEKAEFKYKGKSIHLIKPTTYMNLSGKAVAYWLQELKIPKENLLVILDDIALPFGTLRLRTKGSSAGHNGLKNIELLLAGQEYSRLRFGIGSEFGKGQQVDYVLSNFSQEEFEKLPEIMKKANEMVLSFCTQGAARTMSQYNS